MLHSDEKEYSSYRQDGYSAKVQVGYNYNEVSFTKTFRLRLSGF
jgi:hypothetical protein